jgi:HK97 family phage major capsid protein
MQQKYQTKIEGQNRSIETPVFYRSMEVRKDAINEKKRTVELSFSSEEPAERFFGTEILDHDIKSVNLDRLNKGGPLLMDHNRSDQIGVIEKAYIGSDRKGRALARFGRSGRADEIFTDVLDGIRKNVSVVYRVIKMRQDENSDSDKPVFRVTRWEPMEVSIVSIPMDTSVGVGRSKNNSFQGDYQTMKTENDDKIMNRERNRAAEIMAYGQQFNCVKEAQKAVADGNSVDEFKTFILNRMPAAKPIEMRPEIGLTKYETEQFSFVRAINAAIEKDWSQAPFEQECSRAVADRMNKKPNGFFVPFDVLKRDLSVGVDAQGGYLVATNLLAANFIDMLRNRMMTVQLGATTLTGLQGDVAIPKQTGGATAYWVAEAGAPTESTQAIGQIGMNPKTVGAYTDITRKLLLQSSIDVEFFVRRDLAATLGLALDLAGINGSGASNQPLGILGTSGIGAVAGGTNGLAPAWSHVIGLESQVAIDNADVGSLAYLTNSKVRGILKQTEKATNTAQFVFGSVPKARPGMGEINGYPAGVSNQVPSNLTKGSSSGVCSAIIFGNWSDLVYGMWGALDILVDPYTFSTAGTIRIVALQDVDVAVRHAESFAAMLDALTA